MKNAVSIGLFVLISLIVTAKSLLAHVVVKPSEAGVGQQMTFSVGVPNEKNISTTGLRLAIPDGLSSVTPNVKPGWRIEVKKTGSGENAKVTELNWTGGSIPAGQRDEFNFSAHVPATESAITWKAYQTYSDGSVVSWDQEPKAENADDENAKSGPYSVTQVINDLSKNADDPYRNNGTSAIALTALVLSAIAIGFSIWGKMSGKS